MAQVGFVLSPLVVVVVVVVVGRRVSVEMAEVLLLVEGRGRPFALLEGMEAVRVVDVVGLVAVVEAKAVVDPLTVVAAVVEPARAIGALTLEGLARVEPGAVEPDRGIVPPTLDEAAAGFPARRTERAGVLLLTRMEIVAVDGGLVNLEVGGAVVVGAGALVVVASRAVAIEDRAAGGGGFINASGAVPVLRVLLADRLLVLLLGGRWDLDVGGRRLARSCAGSFRAGGGAAEMGAVSLEKIPLRGLPVLAVPAAVLAGATVAALSPRPDPSLERAVICDTVSFTGEICPVLPMVFDRIGES